MTAVVSIFVVSTCLTVAAAQELPCNVTQSDGQVTYNIEGMSESANQTCDFSWSNKTKHVLANQLEHDEELVRESSAGRLVTPDCLDLVLYEFSCEPKWERKRGECKVVCAEKPLVPTDETPSPEHIRGNVGGAIGIGVAVVVAVLLLFALIGWWQKSRLTRYWIRLTKKMRRDDPAPVENDQEVPLNNPPV